MFYYIVEKTNEDLSGRAVWGVGLGCLDTGIAGSNPAQGMYVCPRLSVLFHPVKAQALRRADHPSKESCQMSKLIHNFRSNFELEQATRSNP
jgi:hypothetical protein